MLWEPHDPLGQLKRRFGFGDGGSVAEWVADALQRHWELDVTRCDRVVISAWNAMAWVVAGERQLIAKWSALPHLFAHLQDTMRVVAWVDRYGLPVAGPLPATDGRVLVDIGNERKGRWKSRLRLPVPGSRFLLGVLPAIDGDLLDVDDAGQLADAGRMLASLHEALASYPDHVGGGRPKTGEQLVHHDFRSANILHDRTRITAVLDFEEVTYTARAADLARAAVLLGTRYRDWRPTTAEVRGAFLAAYEDQARVPLTSAERAAYDEAVVVNLNQRWWATPA